MRRLGVRDCRAAGGAQGDVSDRMSGLPSDAILLSLPPERKQAMLPPVHAIQNAAPAAQIPQPSAVPGRGPSAETAVPIDAATRDANAIVADKLTALIMTSRPGMTQELARVIEAIGKVLDLPRQNGEADVAYALRLAEGLRSATPAQRNAVEQLLKQLAPGADIKIVIEALKNPTGEAAARLGALVEAARFNARELAVRAVVSSYSQGAEAVRERGPGRQPLAPVSNHSAPQRDGHGLAPRALADGLGRLASALKPLGVHAVLQQQQGVRLEGIAQAMTESVGQAATQRLASGERPAVAAAPGRTVRVFQSEIGALQSHGQQAGPPAAAAVRGPAVVAANAMPLQALVVDGESAVTGQSGPQQPADPSQRVAGVALNPAVMAAASGTQARAAADQPIALILKAFGYGAAAAVAQAQDTLKAVIGEAQMAAIRSMKQARPIQPVAAVAPRPQPEGQMPQPSDRGVVPARAGGVPTPAMDDGDGGMPAGAAARAHEGAGLAAKETAVAQERPLMADIRPILREGVPFAMVNYLPASEPAEMDEPQELHRDDEGEDQRGSDDADEQQAFADADGDDSGAGGEDGGEQLEANAAADMVGADFDEGLLDFGYGLYRRNQA